MVSQNLKQVQGKGYIYGIVKCILFLCHESCMGTEILYIYCSVDTSFVLLLEIKGIQFDATKFNENNKNQTECDIPSKSHDSISFIVSALSN